MIFFGLFGIVLIVMWGMAHTKFDDLPEPPKYFTWDYDNPDWKPGDVENLPPLSQDPHVKAMIEAAKSPK